MHFWKFWNCPSKTKAISKFLKITRVIYPKNCSNQTWLLVNRIKPTNILYWNQYLLTASNSKTTPLTVQSENTCVIRDKDNLRKLGRKPQMIDRDTWKITESLQVHISYQRRLYSIVKVMPGFSCAILGYLGYYVNLED